MRIIADLHIHSRFAMACSKQITLQKLEEYARTKGINLLGTGDFQHPLWNKEIKKELKEDENGILWSKDKFPFIWQTEISLIYTQDGKGRRIHNLVFAPNMEVADQVIEALGKRGRMDYDGRPIFGMSCIEFTDMLMNISKDIEIIPAHCWTPWFAIFGSKSGFDSVEECFKEKSKYIHALETGMSSDPAMNWRYSKLDKYNLVSFSDMHSFWPWRIGREATVFDINLTYKNIIKAIRTKKGLSETIEVDPNYGKYHVDGHRACNVCLDPEESNKLKRICPKCRRPLTIGVLNRIEELADRKEGYKPRDAIPFKTLIPLSEILSHILGKALTTKTVWGAYNKLLKFGGSEFNILLNLDKKKLNDMTSEKIADAIIKSREGKIKIKPGYDGVYGKLVLDKSDEVEEKASSFKPEQKGLDQF